MMIYWDTNYEFRGTKCWIRRLRRMGSHARPRLAARALKARLVSSFRMSEFVVHMYTNDALSYQLEALTERLIKKEEGGINARARIYGHEGGRCGGAPRGV